MTNEKKTTKKKGGNFNIKDILKIVNKYKKFVISAVAFVLVLVIALSIIFAKDRKLTITAESSLKEVIESSELSTVEFIYNSTVTVADEKQNPKYHVAYEGTVKAGFDFNQITTEVDDENKKVWIVIPEININSVNIDDESLDFIFTKDKYDTETTFQEAYKASYADLQQKAESNATIKQMAHENAVDTIKAIAIPMQVKLPDGYSFDVR